MSCPKCGNENYYCYHEKTSVGEFSFDEIFITRNYKNEEDFIAHWNDKWKGEMLTQVGENQYVDGDFVVTLGDVRSIYKCEYNILEKFGAIRGI